MLTVKRKYPNEIRLAFEFGCAALSASVTRPLNSLPLPRHLIKRTSPVVQKQHLEVVFVPPARTSFKSRTEIRTNKKTPVKGACFIGDPNEIRTRVAALRGPRPRPLDDGTAVVATFCTAFSCKMQHFFISLILNICSALRCQIFFTILLIIINKHF